MSLPQLMSSQGILARTWEGGLYPFQYSFQSTKSETNVTHVEAPPRHQIDLLNQLVELDTCVPQYVSWFQNPTYKLYYTLCQSHFLFLGRNLYARIVFNEISIDWYIQPKRAKSDHIFSHFQSFMFSPTLLVLLFWSRRLRFTCLMCSLTKLVLPLST